MKAPAHALRLTLPALVAGCLVLAACGGDTVRDEAPLVQAGGWRVEGDDLFLSLRLRNVNDDPLNILEMALTVTVEDAPALRHEASPAVEIAPGGFETVTLELGENSAVTARFARLTSGEAVSLSYRISGTIITADSGDLPLGLEGRVYRVPGRPGEFR